MDITTLFLLIFGGMFVLMIIATIKMFLTIAQFNRRADQMDRLLKRADIQYLIDETNWDEK
jgi:hypothetical protein